MNLGSLLSNSFQDFSIVWEDRLGIENWAADDFRSFPQTQNAVSAIFKSENLDCNYNPRMPLCILIIVWFKVHISDQARATEFRDQLWAAGTSLGLKLDPAQTYHLQLYHHLHRRYCVIIICIVLDTYIGKVKSWVAWSLMLVFRS